MISLKSGKLIVTSRPGRSLSLQMTLAGGKHVVPGVFHFPPAISYVNTVLRIDPDQEIDKSVESLLSVPRIQVPSPSDLFEYQIVGASFLAAREGALLSFAPGLGKTATAITAADSICAKKILVVAPLTLLPTWQREIWRWTTSPGGIQVIRGKEPITERWVVTNFDYFVRHKAEFSCEWDLLILDESILLKNRHSLRFKTVKSMRKLFGRVWALSGAPISVDLSDLWAQLYLIQPRLYSSFWRFVEEYCVINETPWGRSIVGTKRGIDLRREFSDILLTMSQGEALPDLPEVLSVEVPVELTVEQRRVYDQIRDDFILTLKRSDEAPMMTIPITTKVAQLTRLCQASSSLATLGIGGDSAKLDTVMQMAEIGTIPLPCIIWTRFTDTARLIQSRLREGRFRSKQIIGETGTEERDSSLTRFREGDLDFLVMNTSVGKYGLTLTNARAMIYFDLGWDFDSFYQSLHRVRRVGLDHSPVVFKLVGVKTIDEVLVENLQNKSFDLSRLTGDELIRRLL